MSELGDWIARHGIEDVECLVPDLNGIPRGKVMPAAKLVAHESDGSVRLASSIFAVAITGDYMARRGDDAPHIDPDMVLRPDPGSLSVAPGAKTPTAFVFADPHHFDGAPWASAPRHVLKSVIARFAQRGWRASVAPELEFYLTAPMVDPAKPLSPPPRSSGGVGRAPAPYGLEALGDYGPIIDEIYEFAAIAGLELETVIHESGPAQLEINFAHGDPLRRADQTLIFRRIVRQAAAGAGLAATFMAKPLGQDAPSAMHLHLSLCEAEGGRNIFAGADGADSDLLRHFLGGLQVFLPQIALLFAPNVNSFRRLRPRWSAPVNVEWGHDNRTCGLRLPIADDANRRVEIRLAGADANPYLAIAAAMIGGLLGIEGAIEPSAEVTLNAYRGARPLPRTMEEAIDRFAACAAVRDILGEAFVLAYLAIKEGELDSFQSAVTPWEREHLASKV
jgi:glutamine synthetase